MNDGGYTEFDPSRRAPVEWSDHTVALIVGPDAYNKVQSVREALTDLQAGKLSEFACLLVIAGIVFTQDEIAAMSSVGDRGAAFDALRYVISKYWDGDSGNA